MVIQNMKLWKMVIKNMEVMEDGDSKYGSYERW